MNQVNSNKSESIYTRHKKCFDINFALHALADKTLDLGPFDATSLFHLVLIPIFVKAFKSFSAVIVLCEQELIEDAGIVLRSLFNLLVNVSWLAKEQQEERAKRYYYWIWIRLYKMREPLNFSGNQLRKVEEQYRKWKHLFEFTDSRNTTKLQNNWFGNRTLESLAEQVGLGHDYQLMYRTLSSIEHSDMVGLRYLSSGSHADNDWSVDASSEELLDVCLGANANYFLHIFQTWNSVFQKVNTKAFEEIWKDIEKL